LTPATNSLAVLLRAHGQRAVRQVFEEPAISTTLRAPDGGVGTEVFILDIGLPDMTGAATNWLRRLRRQTRPRRRRLQRADRLRPGGATASCRDHHDEDRRSTITWSKTKPVDGQI
jgi:hypothetical protein